MAEYNDNDFGRLIHNIRKSKKIKVDALVKGLCSIKVLYGIEAGDMLPGYLLRSALIGMHRNGSITCLPLKNMRYGSLETVL